MPQKSASSEQNIHVLMEDRPSIMFDSIFAGGKAFRVFWNDNPITGPGIWCVVGNLRNIKFAVQRSWSFGDLWIGFRGKELWSSSKRCFILSVKNRPEHLVPYLLDYFKQIRLYITSENCYFFPRQESLYLEILGILGGVILLECEMSLIFDLNNTDVKVFESPGI